LKRDLEGKLSPSVQVKLNAHNIPNLSPPQNPGVVRTKIDNKTTYRLYFNVLYM